MQNKLKITSILILSLLINNLSLAQSETGFYMDWNIDHSERTVIPSIKIDESEAKVVNCYWVEFDAQGRLTSVKYYFSGNPSDYGNFGAHELERTYNEDSYIERFKNTKGEYVESGGIQEKKYYLNSNGLWTKKENLKDGKLLSSGIAYSKVTRNIKGEIETEIQFSVDHDTIPDGNGFPIVHFAYDENGLTLYRQSRNLKNQIVNGTRGYATVIFQFNQDGMFFEEQFLDEQGNLFMHPQFDLAKINWRDFNKYGKPSRVYYMNTLGYPHENRSYGIVKYRANMTRESITFYNRKGEPTEDINGAAKSVYNYDSGGKYLGKTNYNLQGEEI